MIIIGAINCQSTHATYANPLPEIEQYQEVCKIVDAFDSNVFPRAVLHVIPSSRANFYGGTKVSFTLDYKHSYYPWIDEFIIEALEDLMNVLPFSDAVLYSHGGSCVIFWKLIKDTKIIGEISKYPHIQRFAYGRIDELQPISPSEHFVL